MNIQFKCKWYTNEKFAQSSMLFHSLEFHIHLSFSQLKFFPNQPKKKKKLHKLFVDVGFFFSFVVTSEWFRECLSFVWLLLTVIKNQVSAMTSSNKRYNRTCHQSAIFLFFFFFWLVHTLCFPNDFQRFVINKYSKLN